MPTTAVELPVVLEKFVASQVRERRSEQLTWLQSEIQKGLDSGPAGELDVEKVIQRGRRRFRSRPPGSEPMPRRMEPPRAALADFDAIYYIVRDNPRAAAQVLRSLDRSANVRMRFDEPSGK